MNYLIFNGRRSDEFGLHISGDGTYSAPQRKTEKFTIPGRNGSLTIDSGTFENVSVTYSAAIMRNLSSNAAALREWLLSPVGYCRLEDTYHPNVFRLARYSGGVDFTDFTQLLRAASVKLDFDCKPQRFLKSGEIPVDNPSALHNPTGFAAKPFVCFKMSASNGSVTIGDCKISLTGMGVGDVIIFDAEIGDVVLQSSGKVIANAVVSGEMVLLPSKTAVIASYGIETIKITPRWWTI